MGEARNPVGHHSAAREAMKALAVWGGAALLGCFGPVYVLEVTTGGKTNVPVVLRLGSIVLIFTVAGSSFLMLAFAWLGRWSLPLAARYGVLVAIGAVAGAVSMLPFGTPDSAASGFVCGTSTALGWTLLHLLIYRGRYAPRSRAIEELTDDEIAMIAEARAPRENGALNALLDDQ